MSQSHKPSFGTPDPEATLRAKLRTSIMSFRTGSTRLRPLICWMLGREFKRSEKPRILWLKGFLKDRRGWLWLKDDLYETLFEIVSWWFCTCWAARFWRHTRQYDNLCVHQNLCSHICIINDLNQKVSPKMALISSTRKRKRRGGKLHIDSARRLRPRMHFLQILCPVDQINLFQIRKKWLQMTTVCLHWRALRHKAVSRHTCFCICADE